VFKSKDLNKTQLVLKNYHGSLKQKKLVGSTLEN